MVVNTGGHMNIPSGGISDIERTEVQYPLLYFARNHNKDGFGFRKFRGRARKLQDLHGLWIARLLYRLQALRRHPAGRLRTVWRVPCRKRGIEGPFPDGRGISSRLEAGHYPSQSKEITDQAWGAIYLPEGAPNTVFLPEMALLTDFVQSGGGYGDPLERNPETVARDFRIGAASIETARQV